MANYYCTFSAFLAVPQHLMERAQFIINRQIWLLERLDECFPECEVVPRDDGDAHGFIIFAEEQGEPDHAAGLARAVIEGLELDTEFVASWAYTCSRTRVDAFGGGGVVVKRGYKDYYVDARGELYKALRDGLLEAQE